MYNATTDKNVLEKSISRLNEIYDSIPSTKGCMEWINKDEKDGRHIPKKKYPKNKI